MTELDKALDAAGISTPLNKQHTDEMVESLAAAYNEVSAHRDALKGRLKQCLPLVHRLIWIANSYPEKETEKCASDYAIQTLKQNYLATPQRQERLLTALAEPYGANNAQVNAEELGQLLLECMPIIHIFLNVVAVRTYLSPQIALRDLEHTATRLGLTQVEDALTFVARLETSLADNGLLERKDSHGIEIY